MSFIQMKEVLGTIRSFSCRLLEAYEAIEAETTDVAVKHCLHNAIIQEQELIKCLKQYMNKAPDKVLKVWFQSPGLRQLKTAVKLAEEAEIDSLEDAVGLVVQCDETLLSVYHNLSSAPLSQDVREIFVHLETVRRQKSRNWVWQTTRPRA